MEPACEVLQVDLTSSSVLVVATLPILVKLTSGKNQLSVPQNWKVPGKVRNLEMCWYTKKIALCLCGRGWFHKKPGTSWAFPAECFTGGTLDSCHFVPLCYSVDLSIFISLACLWLPSRKSTWKCCAVSILGATGFASFGTELCICLSGLAFLSGLSVKIKKKLRIHRSQ